MNITRTLFTFLGIILSLPLAAATIHVPGDQPTIQAGIDIAVAGDTVLVADGTWTGTGNINLDFLGKAITVTSENGPSNCIIDCQNDGRGFLFQSGEDQGSILEGFTITNGLEGLGGGIHCFESSPSLRNLVVDSCACTIQGGGIYLEDCAVEMDGCVVENCFSDNSGGGIYGQNASLAIVNGTFTGNDNTYHSYSEGDGGAIACLGNSTLAISESTFAGNHAGANGAAVYAEGESDVAVRNCRFESNTAEYRGGGIYCSTEDSLVITGCEFVGNMTVHREGGAINCMAVEGTIADNLIEGNTGGGVAAYGGFLITRNMVTGNTIEGGFWVGGNCTVTRNTVIGNSSAWQSTAGGIFSVGPRNVVADNIIINNEGEKGGGIACRGEYGDITGNLIMGNTATLEGGGIFARESYGALFTNNIVTGNSADYGGGIFVTDSGNPSFVSNLVANNTAGRGGGIACKHDRPRFWNMTITGNTATQKGGGILTLAFANVRVINSIIWGNDAPEGRQLCVTDDQENEISRLTLEYSDVEGGQAEALVDPGCVLNWWAGMIEADPLFATGDLGEYYLGHIDSDQPQTSPCVNAGDPSAGIVGGTTRTDEVPDTGRADMGFHYLYSAAWSRAYLVAGLGPGPDNPSRIRVFPPEEDADWIHAFQAYAAPHDGVTIACGDVNGDGGADLVTGPGPGPQLGPHVRGFTASGGALPGLSFIAYGTRKYGVNVTAGDFDGDGFDEIVTGPGPGPIFGPHVRGWQYDGRELVNAAATVNFFAYGTPKWGVNVACGDIDGDGMDEIVTGAGPGPIYGAHVRGWNVDDAPATAIPGVSFFAYNTPRYGVRVSCGDIDGDGIDELVTAPGPSPAFGAHVRGWNYDGATLGEIPGVSFFAWPPDQARHGATIFAGADLEDDGRSEIVVGAGPDPTLDTLVRVFTFDGTETTLSFSLQAFPDGWTYGATVAAGRF